MIFSQYKETCEVLLDDPKIGWGNIKYSEKNAIKNILHANIDVNSRRLIAELPGYEIKYIVIEITLCQCDLCWKNRYDRTFQKINT